MNGGNKQREVEEQNTPSRNTRASKATLEEKNCSGILNVKGNVCSPAAPTWFEIDEDKNNNMYVSGLPLDITLDEYKDLMKKCGIVAEDDNGKIIQHNADILYRVILFGKGLLL